MAETPTYHVDIWALPAPEYVCQRCLGGEAYRGTEADVCAHLQTVHQAPAIPTPQITTLLALRTASDARMAAGTPADAPAPPTEETPHG